MLYNKDMKKVWSPMDCASCPAFDQALKKCNGKNKICFEYDPKTRTAIDGVTKLPINFNK